MKTLQRLGMFHGSLISITNSHQLNSSAAIAHVFSLDRPVSHRDSPTDLCDKGSPSVSGQDLDISRFRARSSALHTLPASGGANLSSEMQAASSGSWQHDTAYLSPLLAFNLGFQPQLLSFLHPDSERPSAEVNGAPLHATSSSKGYRHELHTRLATTNLSQQLTAATAPRADPQQLDYYGMSLNLPALSNAQQSLPHARAADEASPADQQQHGGSGPSTALQSLRRGAPGASASSLDLCEPGQPWWGWVCGQVCLQPPEGISAASQQQPQQTVSISQPGMLDVKPL